VRLGLHVIATRSAEVAEALVSTNRSRMTFKLMSRCVARKSAIDCALSPNRPQ
jgi:hypothetical protein